MGSGFKSRPAEKIEQPVGSAESGRRWSWEVTVAVMTHSVLSSIQCRSRCRRVDTHYTSFLAGSDPEPNDQIFVEIRSCRADQPVGAYGLIRSVMSVFQQEFDRWVLGSNPGLPRKLNSP